MKKIFCFCLLFFSLNAICQQVIDQQISIEVKNDSPYYFKNIVLVDNGTDYPDTIGTPSQFLGDSISAADFLKKSAVEGQQTKSAYITKAFERIDFDRSYVAYKSLYESLTNSVLEVEISKDYSNAYIGIYRVLDPNNSINFFAELIQLANGRYRLRQLESLNGDWDQLNQWVVTPRSRNNFFIMSFNGENIEFHRDRNNRNLFFPTERVNGGNFRVIKLF